MKTLFLLASLVLAPAHSYGLGTDIELNVVKQVPAGTSYLRLGQTTEDSYLTDRPTIAMEYTLETSKGHQKRRLWDDDGLATLFAYHRAITTAVSQNKMNLESKLPQPTSPLYVAMEMLVTSYNEAAVTYPEDPLNFQGMIERIAEVQKRVKEMKKVSDLESSGLEALINDLAPGHSYTVEVGNGKVVHKPIEELIGQKSPTTVKETLIHRDADRMSIDWPKNTSKFFAAESSGLPEDSSEEIPAR